MTRLVYVTVEDPPERGVQRVTVTVDVRADTTWDAVGWAIGQLGRGQ